MRFRDRLHFDDSVYIETLEALGFEVVASDNGLLVRPCNDLQRRSSPVLAGRRERGVLIENYHGATLHDVFKTALIAMEPERQRTLLLAISERVAKLDQRAFEMRKLSMEVLHALDLSSVAHAG